MNPILKKLQDESLSIFEIDKYLERLRNEKEYYKPEEDRQLYKGEHTNILNREPKEVLRKKPNGEEYTTKIEMNKLVFNFNQKIVETAIAFLFGEEATLTKNGDVDDNKFKKMTNVWKNVKMDYRLEETVRECMIETKSAILLYLTNDDGETVFKGFDEAVERRGLNLNVKVISREKGDEFYPHFDNNGNMDAFVRKYNTPDEENENYSLSDPRKLEVTEVYTKEKIIYITKRGKDNWNVEHRDNNIKKIPVVYFEKDYPEWYVVQSLINRVEWVNSKHSDTNDYFAFPSLVVRGEINNLPDKNEMGRIFEVEGEETEQGTKYNGGVDFLTWDNSPQSIKDEYAKLIDNIYSMSQTPDISFENLKGIGSVSGIALKLMFLDAKVKARNNKKVYGENIERVINLFKEFVILLARPGDKNSYRDMPVKYMFDDIIPESETDKIENLSSSTGQKSIMSQRTAAEKHPMIDDPEQEMKRINEEKEPENPLQGESFNI